MISKFVEVSNGFNWGKFLVCRFTPDEWAMRSRVDGASLLGGRGWDPKHLWVLDLQTGEGACFRPGGLAKADLLKHQIWACPMYELFLDELYQHRDWYGDITKIPDLIELKSQKAQEASAFYGHRRPGPDAAKRKEVVRSTEIKRKKRA